MRVLIAVAMLAVVGCGGDDGADTDTGAGGTGGLVEQPLCLTYYPHPHSQPEVELHYCVDEDRDGDAICWRTTDEPRCYDGDGDQAVGCLIIRDTDYASAGTQNFGCVLGGECIQHGIDNPECCGDGGGLGAWDCPTTP